MIRFVTHILDVLNVLGMQRVVPPTEYTIRFVNWDGTVLQESQVQEGVLPVYSGATPTKPQDASYTYTFNGWLPSVDVATEDQTYVAQFIAVPIMYTIRFENYDGVLLQESQVIDGETPVYAGATPKRAHDTQYTYIFNGWLPSIEPATEDKTYTAQYTAIPIPAPDPLQPADEIVLSSETGYVRFIPQFTGTAQYTCTLNGVQHTRELTSGVNYIVANDPNTYVYIKGVTGITLREECQYVAVSNELTSFNPSSMELETMDFRNAGNIYQLHIYDNTIVSKIYDTANNNRTAAPVCDYIQRSTVEHGYVWINADGEYASWIINAANEKGWTVLYL